MSSRLAHQYLDGLDGIEIGAGVAGAFNLKGRCRNVDMPGSPFAASQRKEWGRAAVVDLGAYADQLPLLDSSVEYVLTSHVLEHLWAPIRALREWYRVLKPQGLIFAVVPHPERTFDKGRPLTTLTELKAREREPDPHSPATHHSVFVPEIAVELFHRMIPCDIVQIQNPDDLRHDGFTLVARIRKPAPLGTAQPFGPAITAASNRVVNPEGFHLARSQ